jgi:Ni/Co efflux regulator RcnB
MQRTIVAACVIAVASVFALPAATAATTKHQPAHKVTHKAAHKVTKAKTKKHKMHVARSSSMSREENARGAQLVDISPDQARSNELRRCDNLPAFYKNDCIARVNGQGDNQVRGSVTGGGIFVETRTTMTQEEYQRQQAESGAMRR